jgi:hypothetical protein
MLTRHFVAAMVFAAVAVFGPLLLPGKPQAISTQDSAVNQTDDGTITRL